MTRSRIEYRDRAFGRDLLGLLVSVLLHLSPVVLGLLPALAMRLLPKPPIEIEILPPKPKPKPAAPPSEPAVVANPPAAPPRPSPKPPGPGPSNKPAPPPPVQKVDLAKSKLAGLGPAGIDQDVGVRVLLRMPLIRTSTHRPTVEALLHAFPDAHILAAGTRYALPLRPLGSPPPPPPPPGAPPPPRPMARALIDDVDTLLIETAEPQDISATVFYAIPREGSELVTRLSERKSPRWDKRSLHSLRDGLIAFGRADLLGPAPPPSSQPPSSPSQLVPDAAWLEKLVTALRSPGPAVYVEVSNLNQRFRLRSGLPTPVSLRLALSADPDPEIHARVELSSPEEAKQLLDALPPLQRDIAGRLFWFGLGGLFGGLKFQGRGNTVEINGRFPRGDTAVALTWVSQFLPPPDRFLDPPPPAPPVVEVPPDLGRHLDGGTAAVDGGP